MHFLAMCMKQRFVLAGLFLLSGLAAGAANAAMTESEALQAIESSLADGQSADGIIETLVEDGRSLQEATVLAVSASSGQTQLQIARAGICASADNPESQQIGQALSGVPGVEAADIEGLVALYAATGCDVPPESYQPEDGPGGGTPARRGEGGKPPTFPPTRPPPVSPAD